MNRRLSTLFLLATVCAANMLAYTIKPIHAITSEIVTAIHQDPMKFIWFGGSGGLARFDGYTLEEFQEHEAGNHMGYINSIHHSPDNSHFLLATKDGLYLYDFTTSASSVACKELQGIDVKTVINAPDGTLYLATTNGIFILSPQLKVISVINKMNGLGSDHVNALTIDRDGNIIVGHRHGIDVISHVGTAIKKIIHKQTTEGGIRLLINDSNDNLWYAVNNKIYCAPRTAWMESPQYASRLIDEGAECVTSLDRGDQIWIGTRGQGVLRYNIRRGEPPCKAGPLYPNNSDKSEINNSVVSLFSDAENDVWIGTMNGVYLYSDVDKSFNLLPHDPNNSNSPSIDIISSIHIDKDDTVWLGTSYGINKLVWNPDKTSYTITKYVDSSTSSDFVGNNRILMIAPCGDTRFLISTKRVLKIFDYSTGRFYETPALKSAYNTHGLRYVRSYCHDSQGRLFMAFNQGGIGMWSPQTDIIPIGWKGHAQDTHRAIATDRAGHIWVASDSRGVWCLTLSPDGREVESERHFPPDAFGNQCVTALHVDSSHRIWAGTFSGLYMMDDGNRFSEVNTFGPRFYVSSITEDLAHNIWASSTRGVYKIISRDAVNYFEVDAPGNIAKEWYIIGHGIDSSGTIYLGGIRGLIYFNPSSVGASGHTPVTHLSSVKADNVADFSLTQALNSGKEVTFPPHTSALTFELASLNFIDPHATHYAYKLEGYDKDFTRADASQRKITYTNLPPGDYTLKVKSSASSSERYEAESAYHFTIQRPAASSWWAIALYVIAGLTLAWGVWSLCIGRIRRNRESRLYRLKIRTFVSINNKLRIPLASLQSPVDHLLARCEETGDTEARELLDVMKKNIRRMSDQIDDCIDFTSNDSTISRLHLQHIEIRQLIAGVFATQSERAAIRLIDYTLTLDDADVKLFVDVPKLEVALFNLLSNSIGTSAEGGKVSVKGGIDTRHNAYLIVITDGTSVYTKSREIYTLREMFHIAVAKDFVEMNHCRFRMRRATDGVGTVYEIRLPLGLSHYSGKQLESLEASTSASKGAGYINREPADTATDDFAQHNDAEGLPAIVAFNMDTDMFRMLGVNLANDYTLRALTFNKESLSKIKRLAPVCVIMEVSDIETVRDFIAQLRHDATLSGVPVIIVSANSDIAFEKSCYEAGATLWLRQPLDLRYLHTRIDNLIAQNRNIEEVITRKLIVNPKEVSVLTSNEMFLANVMDVVERNIGNEHFSVDMLAASLNISNSVLYRRLKQTTDLSPISFIRSVRIKRAAQLLRTRRYLVSEVCQMVGFSDQRYFSSCFKRQFGTTPKAWSMQPPDTPDK